MHRICLVFFVLLATNAGASNNRDAEIGHLLEFVAHSGCLFIRNGKEHSPQDAVKHIRKKADYYADDIDSAERFIELSASNSTLSKKPYLIQCPGLAETTSRGWLLQELGRYRQQQAAKNAIEAAHAPAKLERR